MSVVIQVPKEERPMLRELRNAYRARMKAIDRLHRLSTEAPSSKRTSTAFSRWTSACEEHERLDKRARDAGLEHLVDLVRGEEV